MEMIYISLDNCTVSNSKDWRQKFIIVPGRWDQEGEERGLALREVVEAVLTEAMMARFF